MKTLRKILAIVIAIATVLSMAACGSDSTSITTPTTQKDNTYTTIPTPSYDELPTAPSGEEEFDPTEPEIPVAPSEPDIPTLPDGSENDIPEIPDASGTTDTPVVPSHTHNYTEDVIDATCTQQGKTIFTCSCGDSYVGDEIPAVGHAWSEWIITKVATETTEGISERNCYACSEVEHRSVPIVVPEHKHSYNGEITKPTCMAGGYTTYSCACGDIYVDNETSATGHKWGEWKTVNAPTDLVEGRAQRTCSTCGKTESKPIAKLPHSHTYKKTVVQNPSCGVAGITKYTCVCGNSYTEKSSALEHTYGDWVVAVEATPNQPGREEMTCSRCGKALKRTIYYEATNADAAAIEAMMIALINDYRAQEGACALIAMPGCNEYAKLRSEQMATKELADHSVADSRAAATQLKYGLYVDPSEYGLPGNPYYHVNASEAVGMNGGKSIDGVAEAMAEGFRNSVPHWDLIGSKENAFIGIGMTKQDGLWYCCIIVAPVNLDTNPLGY